MKFLLRFVEKLLVLLIVLTVLTPLAVAGWLRYSHDESLSTAWLRNATLAGTAYAFQRVEPSISSILSAKYQTALAGNYDHSYAAREVVIHGINELYLRAFRVSGLVEIGRNDTLFLDGDLREYTTQRVDEKGQAVLRGQVQQLKRFQDFCEARKIPFVFMITPNKAAIYPEDMPERWRRRFRPGVRRYDAILPMLKEAGIHYADGHQVTANLKATAEAPLFPKGGIHWGDQASFATANEVLRVLGSQGLPVISIEKLTTKITETPRDRADRDLTTYLNVITEPKFPVVEVDPEPRPMQGIYRPNAAVMGGSFDFKVLTMLDRTGQFSELDFFFYYTTAKSYQSDGQLREVSRPTQPVDFESEVFAADAIIIEANEGVLWEGNHVSRFLRDALAVLPDPHAPKAPYRYLGSVGYKWGDYVSLTTGPDQINPAGLAGFADPTVVGAFTVEPTASLRLKASGPPAVDQILTVIAGTLLDPVKQPEQRAEVYINDHHLGQWVWTIGGPGFQEIRVPKEFLSSGDARLEFRIAKPISPAELGQNGDQRKLGIIISKLRFHDADK